MEKDHEGGQNPHRVAATVAKEGGEEKKYKNVQ
jgi:hypothetical protein